MSEDKEIELDELETGEVFYRSFFSHLQEIDQETSYRQETLNQIQQGKVQFYHKYMREMISFDESWIDTLTANFPSLERIINNPRRGLRYEEEVVGIEKAKKVDAASIRHLASHTHLIKEISKDGIKPKKVLTTYAEEEYGLYENRFIKTLIGRLYRFISNRYDAIKERYESFQTNRIKLTHEFNYADSTICFDLDVMIKSNIENKRINQKNVMLLEKIKALHTFITTFLKSEFMELIKNEKEVTSPIMKTNVILNNIDFRNAYTLWIFLDRYDTLGYEIQIKEKNHLVTPELKKDLNDIISISLPTLLHHFPKWVDMEKEKIKNSIKKQTIIRKKIPDENILSAGGISFTDNTINEYYFQQTKKLLSNQMHQALEEGNTYEQSLKSTFRNMMNITNALYKSVFEVDEEDPRDKKVISLKDQLSSIKRKQKILKQVRLIKEADFRQMLLEEQKAEKELQQVLLKEQKEKEKVLAEKKRMEELKLKKIEQEKQRIARAKEKQKEKDKVAHAKELEKLRLKKQKEKELLKQQQKKQKLKEKQSLEKQRKLERARTSKRRNITARTKKSAIVEPTNGNE